MTREEADKIADLITELVEAATQAVRDEDITLAEAKLQQAHDIALTLPQKKEPLQ